MFSVRLPAFDGYRVAFGDAQARVPAPHRMARGGLVWRRHSCLRAARSAEGGHGRGMTADRVAFGDAQAGVPAPHRHGSAFRVPRSAFRAPRSAFRGYSSRIAAMGSSFDAIDAGYHAATIESTTAIAFTMTTS